MRQDFGAALRADHLLNLTIPLESLVNLGRSSVPSIYRRYRALSNFVKTVRAICVKGIDVM